MLGFNRTVKRNATGLVLDNGIQIKPWITNRNLRMTTRQIRAVWNHVVGNAIRRTAIPGNASRKITLNADVHVAIVQIVIVEYHGARLRNSFAKLTGRSLTSLES